MLPRFGVVGVELQGSNVVLGGFGVLVGLLEDEAQTPVERRIVGDGAERGVVGVDGIGGAAGFELRVGQRAIGGWESRIHAEDLRQGKTVTFDGVFGLVLGEIDVAHHRVGGGIIGLNRDGVA